MSVGDPVVIRTPDFRALRSRNLRGIFEYTRKVPLERIDLYGPHHDGGGTLGMAWTDGATVITDFASYKVMEEFANRRAFKGAEIRKHKKNPKSRAFQSGRKLRVKRSPASEAYRTRLAVDPRRARRVLRKSGYRVNPPRRGTKKYAAQRAQIARNFSDSLRPDPLRGGKARRVLIHADKFTVARVMADYGIPFIFVRGSNTQTVGDIPLQHFSKLNKLLADHPEIEGRYARYEKPRRNPARSRSREIVTITGKRSGRVLAYATPDTPRAELGRNALMLANQHSEPVRIERVRVTEKIAAPMPSKVRSYLANPARRASAWDGYHDGGAAVERAARRFSRFTGHRAERVRLMPFPAKPKAGLAVGPVLMLAYTATRDGKTENYAHKFSPHARPMLVASDDGKTLHLIGGRFSFTERGIVDRRK